MSTMSREISSEQKCPTCNEPAEIWTILEYEQAGSANGIVDVQQIRDYYGPENTILFVCPCEHKAWFADGTEI